jgi:hypothetical protein
MVMGGLMRAADYWDKALTPESYMEQMTLNQELFSERVIGTDLSCVDLGAFGGEPLRVLAITEDFCGDSAQFIPPVIALARSLDNVDVRILRRPDVRELAEMYRRRDGYQAIPVLILIDAADNELGFLIERPQRVYAELAAETRRFAAAHAELEGVNRTYDRMPDETRQRVKENAERFRASQQVAWSTWLFEDLAEILKNGRSSRDVAAD